MSQGDERRRRRLSSVKEIHPRPVARSDGGANFHSFSVARERIVIAPATPPILMSKRVYDGFKTARLAPEIQNGWFTKVNRSIPDVPRGVIYTAFTA
jgi:hypothetical protein